MKKLILTIGLPYSGKSTWAKEQAVPVVNPDSVRLALHGQQFVNEAEPYVWAICHTMVAALFMAGHNRIILDSCNNTDKRRREWYNSPDWDTHMKVFDTSASECIARANAKGDTDIIPVIRRMEAQQDWRQD
ncbi:MAG: AAA family ATPase [Phycisphaerae bacterium]